MALPERLRKLLARPSFIIMPAVWGGPSAKLAAAAEGVRVCRERRGAMLARTNANPTLRPRARRGQAPKPFSRPFPPRLRTAFC